MIQETVNLQDVAGLDHAVAQYFLFQKVHNDIY